MRIVCEEVDGLNGTAQLYRTEDSAVGSKFIYEEMSLPELNRVAQFLAFMVFDHTAREAEASGKRDVALCEGDKLSIRAPALLGAGHPGCADLDELMEAAGRNLDRYASVLSLPESHPLVRTLNVMLHQASYRWMHWRAVAFPDLWCLMESGAYVRVIRGLQPIFRAAARRGDSYDVPYTACISAGKWLNKLLPQYQEVADRNGFSTEWEALSRWAGYMTDLTSNPISFSVSYTL